MGLRNYESSTVLLSVAVIFLFTTLHMFLVRDCRILLKAYILTGDDAFSKVGTKHALTVFEPLYFLNDFAEVDQLSAEMVKKRRNV